MTKIAIHNKQGEAFECEYLPWKNHKVGDGTFKLICTNSGEQLAYGEEWIDKWGEHQVDVIHADISFDPKSICVAMVIAYAEHPRNIAVEF